MPHKEVAKRVTFVRTVSAEDDVVVEIDRRSGGRRLQVRCSFAPDVVANVRIRQIPIPHTIPTRSSE